MAKGPTLNRLSTINGAENDINDNSTRIEAAFENTFSLDGSTPNALQADLDLNGNDVLNAGVVNTGRVNTTTLTIDGQLVVPESVATASSAESVQVTDTGGFYAGETVEAALQEVGSYTSVTATPAELNTLDGITATVTELNHTDGVTSNIQTQLDNKQPLDPTLTTLSGETVTTAGLALLDDVDNTAQRTTLGLGTFAVEDTADYVQSQATWNTGTDTTESTITPAKLDTKIKTLTLGDGQTWQNVSGSRLDNTTYQNTTGRTIHVALSYTGSDLVFQVSTDASTWINVLQMNAAVGTRGGSTAPVPDQHYYRTQGGTVGTRQIWSELR